MQWHPQLALSAIGYRLSAFGFRLSAFGYRQPQPQPTALANGTHFEPQRASVRAGRPKITRESGPHASALRLNIYKMYALYAKPNQATLHQSKLGANRLGFTNVDGQRILPYTGGGVPVDDVRAFIAVVFDSLLCGQTEVWI